MMFLPTEKVSFDRRRCNYIFFGKQAMWLFQTRYNTIEGSNSFANTARSLASLSQPPPPLSIPPGPFDQAPSWLPYEWRASSQASRIPLPVSPMLFLLLLLHYALQPPRVSALTTSLPLLPPPPSSSSLRCPQSPHAVVGYSISTTYSTCCNLSLVKAKITWV
jgi:hypothetical protein